MYDCPFRRDEKASVDFDMALFVVCVARVCSDSARLV